MMESNESKQNNQSVNLTLELGNHRVHAQSTTVRNKNLNENLLSKINIYEERAKAASITKNKKKEDKKEEEDKSKVSKINKIIKSASDFASSPLEEESEEEKSEDEEEVEKSELEEVIKNKVEFNKTVEEMAQYYIREDEISSFYFKQFMETVCIHLFYFLFGPLIIPLLVKKFGRNFIRNMGLWGKKVGSSHLVQICYWISSVLTMIFTFFIVVTYDNESVWDLQFVFLSPAYIAQIMVFIRYITVSVKYGFFPPDYYNKWKTTRLTRTEVKSNFLLKGWIKPSLLVLDVYLKEIFQKFNIDVNDFKFQCVGKLPENMKQSLLEIDKLISEDAKRIRQSIFRRYKKKGSFFNMIQDVMKVYNVGNKENENGVNKHGESIGDNAIVSMDNSNDVINTEKIDAELNSSNNANHDNNNIEINNEENNDASNNYFNNSVIENDANKKQEIELENVSNDNPVSSSKQRFREIILFKLLPRVRSKLESDKNSLESKVICKNENFYEMNGIYLCRAILKDVFTVRLENYAVIHKFFVFLICLVPFLYTYVYYYYFNELTSSLSSVSNSTTAASNSTIIQNQTSNISSVNSTNATIQYDSQHQHKITYGHLSTILLLFSAVSLIPPIWLNTLNLLYGLVDIRRKNKIMDIITEMINTNITENKRTYPLLNVVHSNTMLNWYYLRNLFLAFGKRFSDRIILQTSIFCVFVVISLFISILSLFGYLNQFLATCLGVCFTLTVLINFMIIFRMFLLGAGFNYTEYTHSDLMMTHKLFIDEIVNNSKIQKVFKKNLHKKSVENSIDHKSFKNRETFVKSRFTVYNKERYGEEEKKSLVDKNEFMISNNLNSNLFFKVISTDEDILKLPDYNTYFTKSSHVLENIKEKIKVDSFVRPMKIFWIKADYKIVSQLVALMGTGLAMIFGGAMKSVDITKYLPQ